LCAGRDRRREGAAFEGVRAIVGEADKPKAVRFALNDRVRWQYRRRDDLLEGSARRGETDALG
jgi:hypothetical protein